MADRPVYCPSRSDELDWTHIDAAVGVAGSGAVLGDLWQAVRIGLTGGEVTLDQANRRPPDLAACRSTAASR